MTAALVPLNRIPGESTGDVLARLLATRTKPSTEVAKTTKSTVATRKAEHTRAVAELDIDKLLDLQDKMAALVDRVTANNVDDMGEVLSGEEAAALMREVLDEREVDEFLAARKEVIKAKLFAHFDAIERTKGNEDPENTNGELQVPDLGKRFVREGTGYAAPTVDEARLAALLGDRINEAIVETVVPAHTERHLSVEKLLDMAIADPSLYEVIQDALVPGKAKSPKFTVRDI